LLNTNVQDGKLVGPDPGVRFNYRIWRFLKNCRPRYDWGDNLYYLQAQGYWILANWLLSDQCDDSFARLAIEASNQVVQNQRDDGGWDYPNREWKGRVATVEGIWASLGLFESYRQTKQDRYLQSSLKWHQFFEQKIGFQFLGDKTAVNYFAETISDPVPNNSALTLRYLANLASVTGNNAYLEPCAGLLRFVRSSQLESGEVPYVFGDPKRQHFQCFQYQAFMFLDILEYYRLTNDDEARGVLIAQARFLSKGISPSGFAYYQCGQHHRTVNYHTAVVAAALQFANAFCDESEQYSNIASKAVQHLLSKQHKDGSFPHSRGDHRILSDYRRYPRYLAMILYLLIIQQIREPSSDSELNRARQWR